MNASAEAKSSYSSTFAPYRGSIDALIAAIEPLKDHVGEAKELIESDAWQALRRRHQMLTAVDGDPLLIATLYGPSGSGKSTLFWMLTGIDVPRGPYARPTTRSNFMAVPRLLDEDLLRSVFQEEVEELHDLRRLQESRDPDSPLFYRPYQHPDDAGGVKVALGDVPDFDTFDRENWKQAESMLRRAHIVLYVCYPEGYANERNLRELARCCRLAGKLIYVFTKVDRPEAAPALRRYLLENLARPECREFQERRHDGLTLAEFLERTPMYFSPYAQPHAPTLREIQPINSATAPFLEALSGCDAEQVLAESLHEPFNAVLDRARVVLEKAQARGRELDRRCRIVELDTDESAREIAEGEFQFDRFMQLINEELGSTSSWIWRQTQALMGMISRIPSGVAETLNHVFTTGRSEQRDSLVKYESTSLIQQAEQLAEHWRSTYPDECGTGGILGSSQIATTLEHLNQQKPPEIALAWEDAARRAIRQWIEDHPYSALKLRNALVVAAIPIATLVAADLVVTGSLVTILVGGAISASGPVAALIMRLYGKHGLDKAGKDAVEAWREGRRKSLKDHLMEHFSRLLFLPWFEGRDRLDDAALQPLRDAVGVTGDEPAKPNQPIRGRRPRQPRGQCHDAR